MFLSDVSIKRPVFATMMILALVVLGVVSHRRLAIDEYPDVTYPVVIVQTSYPGASPQVMEREVSRPIEESLTTVRGVKEVTSTSFEGSSIVRVMLHLGTDVAVAQQDVQAKVAAMRRQLPEDVLEPVIRHFDPNERPIMALALQSRERAIRELTDLAEEVIKPRFETVAGVGEVDVVGGRNRQIQVQLDPAAMQAYGTSPVQVAAALQRENQEVPAGRVQRGETERLVRVTGRVRDPRAFADIVVSSREGAPIRIGDVGTVVDGTEEPRSAAFMNGVAAVSLDIRKISGANTVQVADGVRAAAAEIERRLPRDIRLAVIRDDSRRIRNALSDVQATLVLGAVLTIAIIYLFLNSWRSTVITGLTLPVSIISAFFIMWVFGFTVNTMTLMALSLAIGLLIDDAIVVRENIVRHLEMGKDHYRAAREGTNEIGLAVTSTTLAVVAVFLPVAYMGGQIGLLFLQFGVTVAFAVLVSLFVSFTLDPMLSSVWADPEVEHGGAAAAARRLGPIRRFARGFNARFEQLAERYPQWLRWALGHRATVIAAAAGSVLVAFLILPRLGFTWMPEVDGGEFNVRFRMPPGTRLEASVAKGQEIAAFLRRQPDVEFTYLSVGGGFMGTTSSGQIFVRLRDKRERDRTLWQIQDELRAELRKIPGVRPVITGTPTLFGGYRQPIIINVQGPEPTRLKLAAEQVLGAVRRVPGVAEPNSSEEGEVPQLDVDVDREQAWAAGVSVGSIAGTLRPLFAGQRVTQYEDALGYSHDVVILYPISMRASAADVAEMPVPSSNLDATGRPAMVPLAQVAEIRAGVGPQQIERRMLERQISVSAGVLPGHKLSEVVREVRGTIDQLGLPPGYRTAFTGDVQNLEETKSYVLEALVLAVVFIYLILASLFGSFVQPLSIMLALPLSFIGVALALLVTNGNLNVMTMIGLIMLMGLVTKNGILLIDFTNRQRAQGWARTDAILTAARIRLRPILMTSAAMIFGMLPLAFAIGEGSEQRAPMARAIIGGLFTSTLLTLFVVPVVYTLLDDLRHVRAGAWLARLRPGRAPALAEESVPEVVAGD
ncbi:MAG: efflux RND transporter permease subunit [Gemmatimonadetes bacterium]|nr:efflux RND transporter permease subunit [Gemmatimonadota bacterium]